MLVLITLARQLGLDPNAFTDLNIFTHPSGDYCRLAHKLPYDVKTNLIGLPFHTEFGSVTILLYLAGRSANPTLRPEEAGGMGVYQAAGRSCDHQPGRCYGKIHQR
jgi:hypothetical protein